MALKIRFQSNFKRGFQVQNKINFLSKQNRNSKGNQGTTKLKAQNLDKKANLYLSIQLQTQESLIISLQCTGRVQSLVIEREGIRTSWTLTRVTLC